jgi:hypothetical protein
MHERIQQGIRGPQTGQTQMSSAGGAVTAGDRTWPRELRIGFLRKKVCFDYLVHTFSDHVFSLRMRLTCQPRENPRAQKSDS